MSGAGYLGKSYVRLCGEDFFRLCVGGFAIYSGGTLFLTWSGLGGRAFLYGFGVCFVVCLEGLLGIVLIMVSWGIEGISMVVWSVEYSLGFKGGRGMKGGGVGFLERQVLVYVFGEGGGGKECFVVIVLYW